jgi:putative Mn2+ efflux pump MntP
MQPVDWVVAAMTGTVCTVLLIVLLNTTIGKHDLTEEKARIIGGIILSMLSIIYLYIGSRLGVDP